MEVEEIKAAKAAHPEAEVLSHPECPAKVLELSDFVGSTSEIIAHNTESFIIYKVLFRYQSCDVMCKVTIRDKENIFIRKCFYNLHCIG